MLPITSYLGRPYANHNNILNRLQLENSRENVQFRQRTRTCLEQEYDAFIYKSHSLMMFVRTTTIKSSNFG